MKKIIQKLIKSFPDGHFYSPVVNIDEVKSGESRIWPENPRTIGIDFNDTSHEKILSKEFPKYTDDYDYPLERHSDLQSADFHHNNPQFSSLDSITLFIFLRMLKPRRMLEIGSGYSSLLTADVNRRFLHNELEFTCIEPYPEKFLTGKVTGIRNVLVSKVEDLPLSTFGNLRSGDILFIDSSHVSKTGSDVNHIYFEIIPRLNPDVFIHIHDIFLPEDYPKEWVFHEGRSWNEQYLVRALLMFTSMFEVIFGCNYARLKYPDLISSALGDKLYGGGSLWIKKTL